MLKRPHRSGVAIVLAAYLQASILSLAFVICIDHEGGVVLEEACGHCCRDGVPQGAGPDADHPGQAVHEHEHHSCGGCTDIPLLGYARRVEGSSELASPTAAVEAWTWPLPIAPATRAERDAARGLALRPPGLPGFDGLVLNC